MKKTCVNVTFLTYSQTKKMYIQLQAIIIDVFKMFLCFL